MMHMRIASQAVVVLLIGCVNLGAADARTEISKELSIQLQAWNRGDIPAFVETYAVNCTFVGKQILRGRSQLLARYRKSYASPAAMGKLSFTNLEVEPLDNRIAIVTGKWDIDRLASAGGPIGGVFSLVWQIQEGRWRIVLDHTTQAPNPASVTSH
jgi:uncharacterized protein (TIGR02246 family)